MTYAYRCEHDALGEVRLPVDALHGVHTARALEHFRLAGRQVHPAMTVAHGAPALKEVP